MNTKPRSIVMMISLAMAATSLPVMAANSAANQIAGSSFGTSNNTINASTQAFSGSVPAQATMQEAVNAASLPSQSVINTTRPYQDINTQDMMFGEQLFRGAFSTTSGSTFNDSYVINPGDNVQVRMWGAYQYAAIGHKIILNVYKNLDLRLEGYLYQPYSFPDLRTDVGDVDNDGDVTENIFQRTNSLARRYTIATANAVYNSPIGPVSISVNYYHNLPEISVYEANLTFFFHFGYILFNDSALK